MKRALKIVGLFLGLLAAATAWALNEAFKLDQATERARDHLHAC